MPVLGAVVNFASGADLAASRSAVEAVPGVVLIGEPEGARLPIVIETLTKHDDEDVMEGLYAIPGVLTVDLAFADFSDLTGPSPSPELSPSTGMPS